MNYVFSDEVYLPVPITVPADAKPGQTVTLKAAADWLVCKDVCVPEDATLTLDMPVIGRADRPAPSPVKPSPMRSPPLLNRRASRRRSAPLRPP